MGTEPLLVAMTENSPLRVAHIDTEKTWRGGEQQVYSLIKGLAGRGIYNLAVVKKGGVLERRLRELKIPVLAINPWGEWDLISGFQIARTFSRHRIQVIHAHSSHAVALGALSTVLKSLPLVVTRRVDFPLSQNLFSRWKYSRAAKVIAISNRVKDVLRDSGIPPEKIQLVPSGVDFGRYEDVQAVSRKELGIPEDAILIGQVAALAPHKDQATFLKSLALLIPQNHRIWGILVGEGPLRKTLEELAKNLGIAKRIIFSGFKDNPLDYLKTFDLFCLSSIDEGLGTSLLDAMALRVPVVATNTGGIPDLVEDGITGYLAEPQDSGDLAGVISRVLLQPKDITHVILNNAQEKTRKFDINTTISQTLSVYQSLKFN